MRGSLTAAVLVSLVASAPVGAEPTTEQQPFRTGNWSGGAHFYVNGGFSHCAMATSYRSGIAVLFAIDRGFKWRIGFVNPAWNLPLGQVHNVAYVIDQYAPNIAVGRAVRKEAVIAELEPKAAIFHQFRIGQNLTVKARGEAHRFRLDGTANALMALLNCARSNTAAARGATPRPQPPDGPSPVDASARLPDGATAEERLEATRLVANMLATRHLRDFKMLTSAELADPKFPGFLKHADVVWRAPGTISLLRILRNPRRQNLDEIAAMTMASDAAECKGRFISGKIPDERLPGIRREFTNCRLSAGNFYLDYIFVPRPDGLVYRFSSFSLFADGDKKALDTDDRLRNAVKEVVFHD